MDTRKDYVLENDRVKLIPLTSNHIKDLLPYSLNEPDLWKYSLVSASGEKNLKNYLSIALYSREKGTAYPFVVLDKRTSKVVGSTRFYDIQNHHETIQIGYTWYGKDFQGTGINKNCKFLLLEFAFESCDMKRVEFRADAHNAKSIAAMKNIGCKKEGILRSNCSSTTGRRDSIVLSILQSEWDSSVKKNLSKKL